MRVLDIVRAPELDPRAELVEGDLRSFDDVKRACVGIDTVFHTAAVINTLALAPRKERDLIYAVNVEGTKNVIRACRELGIPRLVYTSSVNAVVEGRIEGGDESIAYPRGKMDLYTATKSAAEKAVLAANGPTLSTCALRPGGIYGPAESQHFARLARELRQGRLVALVGDGKGKADNTFVDNLTSAHVQIAEHLAPGSTVAGKAYFINDGEPINYWEFFRPFVEGLGYRMPKLWVPRSVMMVIAFLGEVLHYVGGPMPFMTRMEVRKVCDDHWFRIDKAREDFGWTPKIGTRAAAPLCLPHLRKLHDAA